ncbi:MAG TPA: hypothetical protein VMT03_21975 [Polyangia bacterium]|nr:hypothetical protein [Polyangia bacterium]
MAAETLYRVSQGHRCLDLLVQPWLAIAGAAMVIYGVVKLLPLLKQAREFLARGWVAWVAAAPVALIVVPFLLLFGVWSVRAVFETWADAASTATLTVEGPVTLARSDPYGFTSGRAHFSGTATRLNVDGRTFTGLPVEVIKRIRVGDRVRVTHTPRVDYVTELVRTARAR